MSVKERLKQYIKFKDLKTNAFEKVIGASNGFVNSIRQSVAPDKLEQITKYYQDLNIEWLLTGVGEMIKMEGKSFDKNFAVNEEGNVYEAKSVYESTEVIKKGIPYYNVDFAGGWTSEELFIEQSPDFFIFNPEFAGAEFACNLIGPSISKRIPSGSIIGLKRIEDWQTYFVQNDVHGLIMKNNLRTVKLLKRSKKEGYVTLIPDPLPEYNHVEYEPEDVSIDFIDKLFHVVAYAKIEQIAQ